MLTARDKRVLISVAKYGILSQPQIQKLHFPTKAGYQICQRRFRQELVSNNYITQPFYIDVSIDGSRVPLYKLKPRGRELCETLTGTKVKIPKWNYQKLHHRLETNDLIVDLELADLVKDFKIEYQSYQNAPVIMDAFMTLNNGKNLINVALEVDRSVEPKAEVQRQYKNYEDYFAENGEPDILLYYSKRAEKLYSWVEEVANEELINDTNFTPYFIGQNKEDIKGFIDDVRNM